MKNDLRPRRLVCLVGFMGSGKSTVARLLARQVGWHYVDLDKLIIESSGLSIPEIFERMGEPGFRKIEHDQLARVVAESVELNRPRILSLGGGTTAQPKTWHCCAIASPSLFGCIARWKRYFPVVPELPIVRCSETRPVSAASIRNGFPLTNLPIIESKATSNPCAWWNKSFRWEFSPR